MGRVQDICSGFVPFDGCAECKRKEGALRYVSRFLSQMDDGFAWRSEKPANYAATFYPEYIHDVAENTKAALAGHQEGQP